MNGRFTHAKATEDMDPYAVFSLNEMDVQKERLKTEIVTEALHMHDRYFTHQKSPHIGREHGSISEQKQPGDQPSSDNVS